MLNSSVKQIFQINIRNFHQTRKCFKNHYDTLNLKHNCSQKDIRNSFLKLSKQYHPDRNKHVNSHSEFIKISEAYNVLSKPHLRRDYDLGLSHPDRMNSSHVIYRQADMWRDDSFWEYRNKSEDRYYAQKPYYGIEGLERISNLWIAIICFGVAFIGICLQIMAIRSSVTLKRDKMLENSQNLEIELAKLREEALKNENEIQLNLLKQSEINKNYKNTD